MTYLQFISSKHFFKNMLALSCIVFGFTYIFLITFAPIPTANIRFADTALGFVLGVVLSTTITYYLGGSKSSADKTDIINQLNGNSDINSNTVKTTTTNTDEVKTQTTNTEVR